MDTDREEIYKCAECDSRTKPYHRFCHNCGAYLGSDAEQISIFNNSNLQTAFFFYIIYLFVCLSVKYTDWFSSYDQLFWIEILLAAVTIYFARVNYRSLKPVFRFNNFRWSTLLIIVAIAILFSSIVNIFITEINISFFGTHVNLYEGYKIYRFPILIMFYSIAFIPAVFEELAFRGVLYNYLNTFLDERLVVMVTGFAFAAIHLNFFALLWLVPFGIFIGSLRRKYNTLWYGVIFHFVFNLTACVFDLYRDGELWWM
jgi:membrane protease YdiL (CAAX protease family)